MEVDLTILDRIRSACREVAEQAVSVRIVEERLPAYAAELAGEPLSELHMEPGIHFLDRGADSIAFILTLDAVNFGSGFFPELFGPAASGYRQIAGALTAWFASHGPLSPAELKSLSEPDCIRIFRLPPGGEELAALFARSLREMGRHLHFGYGSRFDLLVEAAGGSVRRLVSLLGEMPSFRDEARYGDLPVPFFKRAQITAADLHIAFRGEGPGAFRDVDRLTIFADNLVPHVLRRDGLLCYHPDLARRIASGEILAAGCREEVEIRACAVHGAELLLQALRSRGKSLNALQLDNFLWRRGQHPEYRAHLRHLTRTIFY